MSIISFAWTTSALLAGRKTCTRRDWSPQYARQFREGDLVDAFNRSPRHGGKKVAVIRLTSVTFENTRDMPDSDYEAEGFGYLTEIGAKVNGATPDELWAEWRGVWRGMYVVRFKVLDNEHERPRAAVAD